MMKGSVKTLLLDSESILQSLREMRKCDHLCDIDIHSIDGTVTRMHGCILSAATGSPYTMGDRTITTTASGVVNESIVDYLYGLPLKLDKAKCTQTLGCMKEIGLNPLSEKILEHLQHPEPNATEPNRIRLDCGDDNAKTCKSALPENALDADLSKIQSDDDTDGCEPEATLLPAECFPMPGKADVLVNEPPTLDLLDSIKEEDTGESGKQEKEKLSNLGSPSVQTPMTPYRFPCSKCERTFSHRSAMHRHETSVHKLKYCCSVCRHLFESISLFNKHQAGCEKAHSPMSEEQKVAATDRNVCDDPKVMVMVPRFCQTLEAIRKNRNQRRTQFCPTCNKGFVSASCLKSHLRIHQTIHKCTKCGQEVSKRDLWYHSTGLCPADTVAAKERPHRCYCGKRFYNRSGLLSHEKKFHKSRVPCETCGTAFDSNQKLQRHQIQEHSKETPPYPSGHEKTYTCSVCHKKYASREYRQVHFRQEHRKSRFLCQECGFSCTARSTYYYHLLKHTNPEPVICDQCGKNFRGPYSLKAHIRIMHQGQEPVSCECGMTFRRKGAKERHQQNDCPLTEHLRQERDPSKWFHCTECPRRFHDKRALRMHEKREHEKMYPCKKCPMEFPSIKLLKIHKHEHWLNRHKENKLK